MKYVIFSLFFMFFISCKESNIKIQSSDDEEKVEELAVQSPLFYGNKFDPKRAINKEDALKSFKRLKSGDTIDLIFEATVNSVCKKKGCWMRLDISENQECMVKFKDYSFFVPKNMDNKPVVVHGKAFVEKTSVKDLQHFAKDAGKTQQEIDRIIEPKLVYAFEADGVYLK